MRRSARSPCLAWTIGALVGACSVGDLDLTGKACPCGAGYACDPARNICVAGPLTVQDASGDDAPGNADGAVSDAPSPDAGDDATSPPSDGASSGEGSDSGCGDTTSDPNNCGFCGHGCQGSVCKGGFCQPTLLAPGIQLLGGLFAGGGTAYWSTSSVSYVCALSGCNQSPASLFSPAMPVGPMAIAPPSLYYTNVSLYQCTAANCQATLKLFQQEQSSGRDAQLVADATSVVWIDNGQSAVLSCPPSGCGAGPSVLASYPPLTATFEALAMDAVNVYWFVITSTLQLFSCARAGCGQTPSVLATFANFSPFVSLATDGAYAYFNMGDSIVRCPAQGCGSTPTTIASGQGGAQALAVYGGRLYWANRTAGSIASCALPDCADGPVLLAVGQGSPTFLAVDGPWVIWANGDTWNVVEVAR